MSPLVSDWMTGLERLAKGLANGTFRWLVQDGPTRDPGEAPPGWAGTARRPEQNRPILGWPRVTDSLCPTCVKEVRRAILAGELSPRVLDEGHPGLISAEIREQDGCLVMAKECPRHGRFEDVLSIDPAFTRRIETLCQDRDYQAPPTSLRQRGPSTIRYGRGAVLTIDLTNRCNMMCEPCFMNANQVGYVHELEWEDIQRILDESLTVQPHRQLSVQFSGGEPTLSPHFLRAIRYARQLGYFSVQCASNGIRFAQEPSLCREARAAGLRLVYLQFDGTSTLSSAHRQVPNLFEVKQTAIDHLHQAGIDVVLVVTVAKGTNDDQVGPVVRFAVENADKITVVSFQPISFSGRAESVCDEERRNRRYTLSHLAHDLQRQTGWVEPLRDWFPLGVMGPLADLVDRLSGTAAQLGAVHCGCHPSCGVGTVLLVHKQTHEVIPLTRLLDVPGFLDDMRTITRSGRHRRFLLAAVGLSLLRRYQPAAAPPNYRSIHLLSQLLSQMGATPGGVGSSEGDARRFPWRFLFVAGMSFQDLWTYDFRRTEMCIIPCGTQEGEISFCAYNTGVGWRPIVERLHATASLAAWHKDHGDHPVYTKGQSVCLPGGAPIALSERRPDGRLGLRSVG